jgi:AcrR family transcriptional regulator
MGELMEDPASASASASAAAPAAAAKTRKGEQTREQILETALALFREKGYEQTTMRAIAQAAGVAVGNAYYYFRSKEHLIQAFYGRLHEDHLAACLPRLAREQGFKARLLTVLRTKIETSMPYHRFSAVLFKTAADPASPLNPFSLDSEPTRRQGIDLFEQVVSGAGLKLPKEVRAELPYLLWLYEMGIILFWLHDASPGCARTYRLIDKSVPLVSRLVALARFPMARLFLRPALALVADLRQPIEPLEISGRS